MSVINKQVIKATDEKLQRPDSGINATLWDFIWKNPDKSELVANAIKDRLLENNTKVQMLALFLLDTMMKKCDFSFHTQIGSKGFMNVVIQLLNNKEVNQQVKKEDITTNPTLGIEIWRGCWCASIILKCLWST